MIYLILVVSAILRMIILNQSLWLDESINVLASKDLGFWHFVTGYPVGDFHPPLYFAILWVWDHLFGYTEIAVRAPSVIFGVASVFLVYLIGKELFSKKVALVGSLLLALSPLHVYYSQEARMYSLSVFSASLSIYFLIKLLKNKKYLVPYAVSVLLVVYSDYVTYLVLPAEILYVYLFERKKWKETSLGLVLGFIPLLPWLTVFPGQLQNGVQTAKNVPGWAAIVGKGSLKEVGLTFIKTILGRVTLANKSLYAIAALFLGAVYGFIFYKAFSIKEKPVRLLILWVFVPVALAFVISFEVPILSYFRVIYILPAFYLLVAYGLSRLGSITYKVLLNLIILISVVCLGFYYLNPNFQREDWKDLSVFLNSRPQSSLIVFENDNLPAPYRYYDTGRVEAVGGLAHFPAGSVTDVADLSKLSEGKSVVFLVDYLVEISDPKRSIDRELTSLGFKVSAVDNFPGVGFVYEYTREF